MRDVTLYSHPVAEPGYCGKCLSQSKDWYVDLGFNIVFNHEEDNPSAPVWTDGAVYLCCDCFNDITTDVNRKFQAFLGDVLETRRGYVTPVGVIDNCEAEIESKYPVRLRPDFPEELHALTEQELDLLVGLNETQREELNAWYYDVLNPPYVEDPMYADYIPPKVDEDDGITDGSDDEVAGTESATDESFGIEPSESDEVAGDSEPTDESSVSLAEFSFGNS